MNVTGRVMLLLRKQRREQVRAARVFTNAVLEVVRQAYPGGRPSLLVLEPLISEQLVLIEAALRSADAHHDPVPAPTGPAVAEDAREVEADPEPAVTPLAEDRPEPPPVEAEVEEAPPEAAAKRPSPKSRAVRGSKTPDPMTMEQKLKDERKPVQKLLVQDCVRVGLINRKRAKQLVHSMVGKRPEDAELEIVEVLRQVLQDQVKQYIRRHQGGPWKSPHDQEDMRKDIHGARSVQSILMLARQIVKERRSWEKANGVRGVLGLFVGRKTIVSG